MCVLDHITDSCETSVIPFAGSGARLQQLLVIAAAAAVREDPTGPSTSAWRHGTERPTLTRPPCNSSLAAH